MFNREEKKTYQKPAKRIYANHELSEFHERMQKYRIEVTLRDGKIVRPYDEIKFLKDEGVMTDTCIVAKSVEYDANGSIAQAYFPYEELMNKIEQWKMWMGRREYGEKKRLEELDRTALAEQMTI